MSSDNWTNILPLCFFFFLTIQTIIIRNTIIPIMSTTIKKPPIDPPKTVQGMLHVDVPVI